MNHDVLTPEAILNGLDTLALPRSVRCYAEVNSTMDATREWLNHASPAEHPLLVVADHQTAGRGRMRRSWVAPPKSALLFSLGLKPAWLAPTAAHVLVWMTGVAVCEGIEQATGLAPRLKWPNDVLLSTPPQLAPSHDVAYNMQSQPAVPSMLPAHTSKVAGILLEMSSTEHMIERAIIGVGINIHAHPPADALRYAATHLSAAYGQPVERLALLRAIIRRMNHWYTLLQHGEEDQLFAVWRALLLTLGHTVNIETANGLLSGVAEDVEPSGALRVRSADGHVHVVMNGDVNA